MECSLQFDKRVLHKYKSVSCNELSKCVIEGKKEKSTKYKINNRDIEIVKFLYKFKFATESQIERYLDLLGLTSVYIASRIDKLNKIYKLTNAVELEKDGKKIVAYCLDIGGMHIVDKYTNIDVSEDIDVLNFHKSIYDNKVCSYPVNFIIRSLISVNLYLKIDNGYKDRLMYVCNRQEINLQVYKNENKLNSDYYENEHDEYECIRFKVDLVLGVEKNEKVDTYFINFIHKYEYDDIKKISNLVHEFDKFVQDEDYIQKYCPVNTNKPKLVIIFNDEDSMHEAFNSISNYWIDCNNIYLSFYDKINDENIELSEVFFNIGEYL